MHAQKKKEKKGKKKRWRINARVQYYVQSASLSDARVGLNFLSCAGAALGPSWQERPCTIMGVQPANCKALYMDLNLQASRSHCGHTSLKKEKKVGCVALPEKRGCRLHLLYPLHVQIASVEK